MTVLCFDSVLGWQRTSFFLPLFLLGNEMLGKIILDKGALDKNMLSKSNFGKGIYAWQAHAVPMEARDYHPFRSSTTL